MAKQQTVPKTLDLKEYMRHRGYTDSSNGGVLGGRKIYPLNFDFEDINPSLKKQLKRNDFGKLVNLSCEIYVLFPSVSVKPFAMWNLVEQIAEKFSVQAVQEDKHRKTWLEYRTSVITTEEVDNFIAAIREYDELSESDQVKIILERFEKVGLKGIERLVKGNDKAE